MRFRAYNSGLNHQEILTVVKHLKDGALMIYPTDTVYAMGCSIYQSRAIERLAALKGKKVEEANFSIICADLSHLSQFCKPFNNPVFKMMKHHLPGPFTFILEANGNVPKIFKNKRKTIGIRVVDCEATTSLVAALGHPIVTTSLLDSDEIIEYTTDPDMIYDRYQGTVDVMIDGGYGGNEASTIVDCTVDPPEIIRQGLGVL